MSNERKIFILGAGPAGLALADGLAEAGIEFDLIERSDDVGGLARTLKWGELGSHDLGPHKIFTKDEALLQRVKNLIPADQWLTREKKSSIFIGGHYLPYPPSPFSLLKVYGLGRFISMVFYFGVAQVLGLFRAVLPSRPPRTFEEDLHQRVGKGLYEVLFKPIALKLWADPSELDVKLSQGRVQTPSVLEIIKRLLKINTSSEFEALEFIYPKNGLQMLWRAIEARSSKAGRFHLKTDVTGLTVQNGRITAIETTNRETNATGRFEVGPEDFVLSSLPLGIMPKLMGNALAPRVAKTINEIVQLNDLLLVFLKCDQQSVLDDSWIFIPDPKVIFHRVSEQESFDPGMTPRGSIVCCEVMSSKGRPMAAMSDQDLIGACVEGLHAMRIRGFRVEESRVIRLPASYPVFKPGYELGLEAVLSDLDQIKNFRTIGRQGAFNYIGTLDAMDIGYGSARWLKAHYEKLGTGDDGWSTERVRTRHYAVLD